MKTNTDEVSMPTTAERDCQTGQNETRGWLAGYQTGTRKPRTSRRDYKTCGQQSRVKESKNATSSVTFVTQLTCTDVT